MPQVEVRAFRDGGGNVPVLVWLEGLERSEPKAYRKCLERVLALSENGNQIRRPRGDYLRDGIYELRATFQGNIHHRILYFFNGKNIVVLSHGVKKVAKVPPKEIDLAVRRKQLILSAPDRYTADFEME